VAVAVAVALAVLAAGVSAAADDGIGLPLRRVRLDCDAWFDSAGMRRLLPLALGEPVTVEQIAASRQILKRADIFRTVTAETRAVDGGAEVIFHLQRKLVLTEITASGYDYMRWRDVYRLLRLRSGSFYDAEAIEAARQRLVTRYTQIGFPRARVTVEVRQAPGEATAHFDIEEGTPTTVTAVEVTGDTGSAAAALEPPLRKVLGKPYGRDSARIGERELLGRMRDAGYYEAQIDSEWLPAGETAGSLRYTVDAGPRTIIEITGNECRSRQQLLSLMDLRTRLIITDGTWRELARRMRRFYQEWSYYRATVKVRIEDGDPRRVLFTIDEGRPYVVRRIDFSGNQQLSADALRAEMNTRPASLFPVPHFGAFVRPVFDEDLRRLWYFYREQGFDSAEIVDAPIDVDDATGSIDVTIVVDEGPRTIVATVTPPDLAGLPPDGAPLTIEPGQPLLPADLDTDTRTIVTALRRDGYTEATVTPVVTRRVEGDVAEATIEWTIERGPRRTVGEIIVQGNVETYDEIVRRELPFTSGDPLDPEKLQEGQDNIYKLGTYRSVAVEPLDPHEVAPPVGVAAVPRPPGSVQWGVGYNTRDGFTGFGEIAYDNLGHRARRASIRGQGSVTPHDLSSTQFLTVIGYREPQFQDTPWTLTLQLIGERSTKTIDQYDILRGSASGGFSRMLTPRLRFGLEVQFERDDVFNVTPSSFRLQDTGIFYTTAPSASFIYDGRNDFFAPTRGLFDSATVRYAPPGISTVQFGALNLQHSQAFPLAEWLSFIYSARVGYGHVLSGATVLPIQERYFLGGSTSVRGYSENSLGPTDPNGNVIGGDLAMVLSLELRVPIIYQLSGAVFNDNGGLFLTQCDHDCSVQNGVEGNTLDLHNFRHSVGPGLRYMTPVGPISLDYGFKIDRRSGESVGEVHFSISGTF
jgi:outer membrane protein insertion porin family